MGFLYDRTVSVTRNGATVYSGIAMSIQQKRPQRYEDMAKTASPFFHDLWTVLPSPFPAVTLQDRDLLTDDTGAKYRVVEAYTTPLGLQAIATLAGWDTDTVLIAPCTGIDNRDQPTFGPAVSYSCRVVRATRRILKANGEEMVSNAVIYFDGETTAGIRDQVTLPEDSGAGQIRPILEVDNIPDLYGQRYGAIWVM
ncbi:MAG: hypothetical protein KGR26_08775 [Cyanobacteria bacterium REEB65]|nr:hypothetical protein [Cyanobacteria bacterium REEB65]